MNRGLITIRPKRRDLVAGSKRRLGSVPITDGHWAQWLPAPKDQQINGVEPNDCVSHGTLKAVEILLAQELGEQKDYSERFLAKMTGTDTQLGNDPNTVAQFLKNKGCVLESEWPTTTAITSFAGFYSDIPIPVQDLAQIFVDEFAFGHEWLYDTSAYAIMDALKYSPLGAGVYAWQQNMQTGYYDNPGNLPAEHYVTIYDYEANNYWLAFDSYAQEVKKLAWDFPFSQMKKYTIHRQIIDDTAWGKFLAFIHSMFGA